MSIHKILSWTAVILWMALIFNLSSQVTEQSNQLSMGITEIIVETVERIINPEFDSKHL
jgi:VanZ family protein